MSARWKMGRKRLAYTSTKKNNGFYVFFEFKGPGDLIAKMDRTINWTSKLSAI